MPPTKSTSLVLPETINEREASIFSLISCCISGRADEFVRSRRNYDGCLEVAVAVGTDFVQRVSVESQIDFAVRLCLSFDNEISARQDNLLISRRTEGQSSRRNGILNDGELSRRTCFSEFRSLLRDYSDFPRRL